MANTGPGKGKSNEDKKKRQAVADDSGRPAGSSGDASAASKDAASLMEGLLEDFRAQVLPGMVQSVAQSAVEQGVAACQQQMQTILKAHAEGIEKRFTTVEDDVTALKAQISELEADQRAARAAIEEMQTFQSRLAQRVGAAESQNPAVVRASRAADNWDRDANPGILRVGLEAPGARAKLRPVLDQWLATVRVGPGQEPLRYDLRGPEFGKDFTLVFQGTPVCAAKCADDALESLRTNERDSEGRPVWKQMHVPPRLAGAEPIRIFVNRDRNNLERVTTQATKRLSRAVAATFPERAVDIIRRHGEVALDWVPFAKAVPRSATDIRIQWKRVGVTRLGLTQAQLDTIRRAFDLDAPSGAASQEEWTESI